MSRKKKIVGIVLLSVAAVCAFASFYSMNTRAAPIPSSWDIVLEGTHVTLDDTDYKDDILSVGVTCEVPDGEVGAYMAIFFNGSTTAFSTTSVPAGSSLYRYKWTIGEYGNGNNSAAYRFVIKLFDCYGVEKATIDDVDRVFVRG